MGVKLALIGKWFFNPVMMRHGSFPKKHQQVVREPFPDYRLPYNLQSFATSVRQSPMPKLTPYSSNQPCLAIARPCLASLPYMVVNWTDQIWHITAIETGAHVTSFMSQKKCYLQPGLSHKIKRNPTKPDNWKKEKADSQKTQTKKKKL